MLSWLCAIMMLFASVSANSCNSSLRALENHLYEGKFNQKELNKVFFPQMHPTARHVKVEYIFEGDETDDECSVTYYWSIGGFLLIQPPSIFRFTSLHFSYPVTNLQTITLTLSEECRPLVYNSDTQKCSCKADGDTLLDILTHHVSPFFCVSFS